MTRCNVSLRNGPEPGRPARSLNVAADGPAMAGHTRAPSVNTMNTETLNQFKRRIEDAVEELRLALEEGGEGTRPVQLDTSIGRLSRMDAIQSQQMALALKQRQREQLQRLKRALERVADGTYGQCRKCRGVIAIERLEAQPDAVFCVDCAAGMQGSGPR